MSLMSLNIFVLKKINDFLNLSIFLLIFLSSFNLSSVNTGQTFFSIECKLIFLLADFFKRTVSWLWYYEFSYKIL